MGLRIEHVLHSRSVIMGLGGARYPLRTSLAQGLQWVVKPSRLCRSLPKANNSLFSLHMEQTFIVHYNIVCIALQARMGPVGSKMSRVKNCKEVLTDCPWRFCTYIPWNLGMRCCYNTTIIMLYAPTPSHSLDMPHRPLNQKKSPTHRERIGYAGDAQRALPCWRCPTTGLLAGSESLGRLC